MSRPAEYDHARVAELGRTWGRAVYEAQPDGPAWAAGVLETAQSVDPNVAEVVEIVAVARAPAERRHGHDAFQSARLRYLAEERGPQRSATRTTLLRLAELVAKAAYNDTGLPAPFDAHAPWRIGPYAVQLAAVVDDPAYEAKLRAALGSWPE